MDYGNPTSHSYFSQRLRLHYLDWGNPGAPHLLLLHGIHDQCHSWDWVARSLRGRFHVIAPDLRGHGDSQWTRGSSYAWLEYVQDIAQLVRQAELEPVTLVAHSMGGTIAALYAGIFPGAVAKLVIVEGVGLHPDRTPMPAHERLRYWISLQLRARRAHPASLSVPGRRRPAHAGDQSPPEPGAGPAPHRARRRPERGRHVHLEVRQLHAHPVPLRRAPRGHGSPLGTDRLPRADRELEGRLRPPHRPARHPAALPGRPASSRSATPGTGRITTSSTRSWRPSKRSCEGSP